MKHDKNLKGKQLHCGRPGKRNILVGSSGMGMLDFVEKPASATYGGSGRTGMPDFVIDMVNAKFSHPILLQFSICCVFHEIKRCGHPSWCMVLNFVKRPTLLALP